MPQNKDYGITILEWRYYMIIERRNLSYTFNHYRHEILLQLPEIDFELMLSHNISWYG